MYLSALSIQGFRAAASSEFNCRFPGRFSVLVGANNAGKTTVCEALYLAHIHRFPQVPRPSVSNLGDPPRSLAVEFEFGGGGDEGPLGQALLAQSQQPPKWRRRLERSLGSVRAAAVDDANHAEETRLIYLPAQRNPVDELARREAAILVELLRAEQERLKGHRNLADLRGLAGALLDGLLSHELLHSVEARVSAYLQSLTGGASKHHAFIGRQEVDDAFLARVLEFLLASVDQRSLAQRLEISGLGYVNLLHMAVTLSAIPGGSAVPSTTSSDPPAAEMEEVDQHGPVANGDPSVQGPNPIDEAGSESEALEDAFFPELFHVTVVVEEPEAHLHPQLQHGLMRYLRQVTLQRPEIQLIVSTHSGEMLSACSPSELVVLKPDADGRRRCLPLVELPIPSPQKERVFRLAQLHMDATRNASLFSSRLVLVEGVTDALLLRVFGKAWANDPDRQALVDALTIIPVGSKVGEWTLQLLASPGFEIVDRVAILRDTDDRTGSTPGPPSWLSLYDSEIVACFLNHPTLEPSVVSGNEGLIASALDQAGITRPPEITSASIDDLFRNGAGPRKGEFAFALAEIVDTSVGDGETISVPEQFRQLFEFLFPAATEAVATDDADAAPSAD